MERGAAPPWSSRDAARAGECSRPTSDTAWTTTPSVGASYSIVKTYTSDGTHPSTLGHLRAAAKIDTAKLVVV
jgi:hypothetical protein